MTDDRTDKGRDIPAGEMGWSRSERRSFWIALAIALAPIPASLLFSWAVGSPPWRPRPSTPHGEAGRAPADPGRAGPSMAHGHR